MQQMDSIACMQCNRLTFKLLRGTSNNVCVATCLLCKHFLTPILRLARFPVPRNVDPIPIPLLCTPLRAFVLVTSVSSTGTRSVRLVLASAMSTEGRITRKSLGETRAVDHSPIESQSVFHDSMIETATRAMAIDLPETAKSV